MKYAVENQNVLFTTLRSSETSVSEEWILSCQAEGVLENNSWFNSSAITILSSTNTAPNTPTITINSTDGLNATSSTLNCSATLTDNNTDNLNITVYWYENETKKLEVDYNNSWANGTAFNATLSNTYTNKDDTWHCAINITDGTETIEANSSSMTIIYLGPTYTEFDETDTTDFTIEVDISSVSKMTLHNSHAKITWLNNVNATSEDYDTHIEFSLGSVFVNSSALDTTINSSANITIYNLDSTKTPVILMDGALCPASICEQISYTGGTLVFNVTHFTTFSTNYAPDTPIVTLESIDGLNLTSSTLNCSANITDGDGANLNVTVRWFENGTQKLEVDYNNSWANETLFNATLASSYTEPGDNWSCKMKLYDAAAESGWGNSTNLTILNSAPTILNSRVDPPPVFGSSNLTGHCNASDLEGENLTYYFKWWNGTNVYVESTKKHQDIVYWKQLTEPPEHVYALDSDDKWLYAVGKGGGGFVYNKTDLSFNETLTGTSGYLYDVHNDDDFVYVGGEAGIIYKWNKTGFVYNGSYAMGSLDKHFVIDDKYAYTVAHSTDGIDILNKTIGGSNGSISTTGSHTEHEIDSKFVYYSDRTTEIQLYNKTTRTLNKTLTDPTGDVQSFFTDTNYLYAGDDDGTIYVYNKSDYTLLTTLIENNGTISALSGNSDYIVGVSEYGEIYLYSIPDFDRKQIIEEATDWNFAYDIEISNDYLFVGKFREIYVYNFSREMLESTEYRVDTVDSSLVDVGETWILSCMASDGTSNSSWMNSSTITVVNEPPLASSVTIESIGYEDYPTSTL
ncbi:hypothetical protein N9934_05065, partial [Desulfosarcina sp.]|nr:hypothetical protein [Desulfosarcina sp.]